jgi:hypothetical protein
MRLVNEFGNVVVYTESKRKIERLKTQGYRQCELPTNKEAPKVEGAVKKNVNRNKTNAKRDI